MGLFFLARLATPATNGLYRRRKEHLLCSVKTITARLSSPMGYEVFPLESLQTFHYPRATSETNPFQVSAWVDKFKLGPKSNYMFKTYVPKIKDAKVGLTNPKERPTFPQFIDYLLVTDISEYNDHWIPYWLHCKICWIEYDIIGKFLWSRSCLNCNFIEFIFCSQIRNTN